MIRYQVVPVHSCRVEVEAPDLESLLAILRPKKGDYQFFVHVKLDGKWQPLGYANELMVSL